MKAFNKSTKSILTTVGVAVVMGALSAGSAVAAGTPSAKATFAYNDLIDLPTAACSSSASGTNPLPAACDSDWKTVLKQELKTANQKDLFIDAALQCGIVTDTTVKSLNGSTDTSEARGTIRVRVQITGPDGVTTTAYPQAGAELDNTGGLTTAPGAGEGIVYCDRIQQLKAKFSGLNCTAAPYGVVETPVDLVDGSVTCADPEELSLLQKTLNAASFNFVAANVKSGVNTIRVQARTTADTGVSSTDTSVAPRSLAGAEAFVGMGAVSIEEVRMIKGNDGSTLTLD